MNNQQLEMKIKEILNIENFFDMIEAVVAFKNEYKQTDFYKATKMPLMDVIKNAKLWYTLQFNDIANKIQNMINSLDLTKISEIIEQLGELYGQENAEIMEMANSFKEIIGE